MSELKTKKPASTKITKLSRTRTSKGPQIIAIAADNPNLTTREIGKLAGCTHSNVVQVLKKYDIEHSAVEDFKTHRAEIFAGMQNKFLMSLTEADIKAMPGLARLTGLGILFDKERIERGQSTSNIDIRIAASLEVELKDLDRQIQELSQFNIPSQNTPENDDTRVIEVSPENS